MLHVNKYTKTIIIIVKIIINFGIKTTIHKITADTTNKVKLC